MNTIAPHARIAIGLGGLSAGVILALALGVLAEDSELDTDPRAFPYQGILEFDGESYHGQADLRFSLTDDEGCDYAENHDAVPVYAGRFSVNIGSKDTQSNPLPDCVFNASRVFISMAVRASGDTEDHLPLSGRQRIHPVPFAYWAAEGSDVRVDGNLSSDTLSVSGAATLGGNLKVEGSQVQFSASGQKALQRNNNELQINPSNSFSSGVSIGSNTLIGGQLTTTSGARIGGQLNANSGLQVTGTSTLSGGATIGGGATVSGTLKVGTDIQRDGGDVTIRDNLDITGDIQDLDGAVTINDDLDITGNKSLSVASIDSLGTINADGGAFSTGGDLNVGGKLDVGYRIKTCNISSSHVGVSDCLCSSGEVVVGGGGYGDSAERFVLRESRPIVSGNIYGWRVACLNRKDGTSGDKRCTKAYAICVKFKP